MRSPSRREQGGYALLMAVVLLLSGATIMATNSMSAGFRPEARSQLEIIRAQRLAKEARQALIGYAVTNTTQLGALPCPDTSGFGSITGGATCSSSTSATDRLTGCLPWKSLGLQHGFDESGTRLMYSLSASWRNTRGATSRNPDDTTSRDRPINPGNYGSIPLHSDTTATPTTIVAAVFSPGFALTATFPPQDRASATEATLCGGSGLNAFLESASDKASIVINNAATTPEILLARNSATFNDRVAVINREDIFGPLMRPVLAIFRDGGGKTNFGLPYYLMQNGSLPSVQTAALTPSLESQKAAATMNRMANPTNFDLSVIPEHFTTTSTVSTAGSTYACLSSVDNKPANWLCSGNWYQYLEYSKTPQSATLTFVLDRRTPSRVCQLSTGVTAPNTSSETLTCNDPP